MKRILSIVVLVQAMLLLSGCDAVRSYLGRPTSSEIAAKRASIQKEQQDAYEAQIASLAAELQAQRDSIALAAQKAALQVDEDAALAAIGMPVINYQSMQSFMVEPISFRYCVVLGTYATTKAMNDIIAKCRKAGYTTATIPFRSGRTAVCVGPTYSIEELSGTASRLRKESFCTRDASILAAQ